MAEEKNIRDVGIVINDAKSNASELPEDFDQVASKKFQSNIITTVVRPYLLKDFKDTFKSRHIWAKVASVNYFCAELFVVASLVLSFIASSYGDTRISFASGLCSVGTIALNRLAGYYKNQSTKATFQVNELLHALNIKYHVPDLLNDIDSGEQEIDKVLKP